MPFIFLWGLPTPLMTLTFCFCSRQFGKLCQRRQWLAKLAVICMACSSATWAQLLPLPQRIANSAIQRWPLNSKTIPNEQLGPLLNGMNAVWYDTANSTYYRYAKHIVDERIAADGYILTASAVSDSRDALALGQPLLLLYRVTQEARYYRAVQMLDTQFASQLRDHSPTQPNAFLIALPFYAEYASVFDQPEDFKKITHQFVSMERQTKLSRTPVTAAYIMALVNTLPYYPKSNPGRATLLEVLHRTAAAAVHTQEKRTGSGPEVKNNEPISACMFVYALQKGVRLGYLPLSDARIAAHTWREVSHPPLSSSYTDASTTGALLLASTEMEMAQTATLARGKTVLLDAWFNSQQKKNAAGQEDYFHYKWNDYSNDGYSILGHIFTRYGATLDTLYLAPTLQRLHEAQFYIIVSPDIPAKNPHPHYVLPENADQVAAWVRQGGVLVLMENDPANADIVHLDLIADRFGIHFNQALSHHILGDAFAPGEITTLDATPLFHESHTLYMKDTCTLTLKAPAIPLLTDATGVVMATAKYGKGKVVAVVDPWLYNEYTDHRKLLPVQDNYAAGKEFVNWLLEQ